MTSFSKMTLAAVALLAGCGEASTAPIDRRGEYRLVTVNGLSLPAAVSIVDGTRTITELTSGTLRLWPDDTHTLSFTIRSRIGEEPEAIGTLAMGGDYAVTGSTVLLEVDALGGWTGTFGRSGVAHTLSVDAGSGFGLLAFRKVE